MTISGREPRRFRRAILLTYLVTFAWAHQDVEAARRPLVIQTALKPLITPFIRKTATGAPLTAKELRDIHGADEYIVKEHLLR